MQFTKLKDGRVVNRECRYIVIHPIGKEYEITLGVEVWLLKLIKLIKSIKNFNKNN